MIDLKTYSKALFTESKQYLGNNILPYLKKQKELFRDKWLVNRVRLGVTGLSQSGKTTFITSLIYHLLRDATLAVSIELASPQQKKRFPYEQKIACLKKEVPDWPQSTCDESEICLRINNGQKEMYLEIVDYPGEWLLDLPLMEKTFAQWSKTIRDYLSRIDEPLPDWAIDARKLADDDDEILETADKYRQWLFRRS